MDNSIYQYKRMDVSTSGRLFYFCRTPITSKMHADYQKKIGNRAPAPATRGRGPLAVWLLCNNSCLIADKVAR